MLFTKEILSTLMPKTDIGILDTYLPVLRVVLPTYGINTPLRMAHFIAQIMHESGDFRSTVENLNYSSTALRAVFGKYFNTEEMASEYHRQPEKIANVVYANRMGNGDTESGDGWRYRGRGLIQLTGKNNCKACGDALGVNLVDYPELLSDDPMVATYSACWYWSERKLNKHADNDDLDSITKRINGGMNGIEHRKKCLSMAKLALGITE